MGLLCRGVASLGALGLGTVWFSPSGRQTPAQCQTQQDRYRQMATVIGCNSDTAVLIFWLDHNPPLPPLLSLQAPRAHTDLHHYSLLGRRCGSGG